jgi:hypothetical protein
MPDTLVVAAYLVTYGTIAGYAAWLYFRWRADGDQEGG